MPTYDYECTECSHRFELFQNMTAAPISVCPKCNGVVKRLIGSGAGIIFKGSGFYETDYKRKEKKEAHKESDPPACPGANKACPAS
ncbi:MAG: FmdB family zinc ribbon protein, partial [Candidatus Omnitrophota bacterium]